MVQNISTNIPREFRLYQNYPNPFNPVTRIRFDVPQNGGPVPIRVRLIIYDMLGREMTRLIDQELVPGTYKIDFDCSRFTPGLYYYRLVAERFTDTKKMFLVK
jgi:hypothetical protein